MAICSLLFCLISTPYIVSGIFLLRPFPPPPSRVRQAVCIDLKLHETLEKVAFLKQCPPGFMRVLVSMLRSASYQVYIINTHQHSNTRALGNVICANEEIFKYLSHQTTTEDQSFLVTGHLCEIKNKSGRMLAKC
jgi:hypothetical protein